VFVELHTWWAEAKAKGGRRFESGLINGYQKLSYTCTPPFLLIEGHHLHRNYTSYIIDPKLNEGPAHTSRLRIVEAMHRLWLAKASSTYPDVPGVRFHS
jgi:hypothetical protein